MSAFDKVIGYDSIKTELLQVCDVIHNPEVYSAMGARLPRGILLSGEPGLGKTLLAKAFIEESGLQAYPVRRDTAEGDFISDIAAKFGAAKEHAPAIVFLDDMDKFANEDDRHPDAAEYVAVQAGIDVVRDSEVYVIATVNDEDKLPESLIRPGRFDRYIHVETPCEKDAEEIIKHYLSGKKLAEDVDLEDVSKMIRYSSCAELETILNEAAILAAFDRKPALEMGDIVKAVLRMTYKASDDLNSVSDAERAERAIHEAGHLVVSEVLIPGSVGMASIQCSRGGSAGGFIHMCTGPESVEQAVMIGLGGKCASEMINAAGAASGCTSDLRKAVRAIRDDMLHNAGCGFALMNANGSRYEDLSGDLSAKVETAIHLELEKYAFRTRDILKRNEDFLCAVIEELSKKETLLYSDIRAIREKCGIGETA